MIAFLVGTAALFAALGDYAESAVLACALPPILGMDAWLHRRTRASTAGLAGRLSTRVRVVRDGALREVPAAELIPGDLVQVQASGYLPADGLVLAGQGLQIDTSTLTGESLPQRKAAYNGLAEALREGVVARCLPLQKLDIVRSLQARREIVAVTGDGVNDVPALQGADVGIAMGERGTRPAREVASIVLMDDNFRTLARAIAEGRHLFESLKLSFAYLLIVHVPLVLTAALVPLAGFPLLYLPIHIVWLELLIHPTAMLAFQALPVDDGVGPGNTQRDHRFFSRREWAVIAGSGALLTTRISTGYAYSLGPDQNVGRARSMAMLMLIVASATTTPSLTGFRTASGWIAAAATLLSAVLVIPFDALSTLLGLQALRADDWLLASATALAAGSVAMLLRRRDGRSHRP